MTAVDPEQVADILDRGADWIDEHGWVQGDYFGSELGGNRMAACMLGGLRAALGCTSKICLAPFTATMLALYTAAQEALEDAVEGEPASFNDHPGREQWEVLELMRGTAKRVRAGDLAV